MAKAKWKKIEDNIVDSGVDLPKFIRHHWLSKYSFIGEKALFKNVKREISDFSDFLDELVLSSELYKKIMAGKKDDWMDVDHGAKIYESISGIRAMNVVSCNSLLLCLLRNEKRINMNLSSYIKTMEEFTFVYSGICKLQANRLEKIYAKYAIGIERQIKDSGGKHVQRNVQRELSEMIEEFKELKPSKNIFDENFREVYYRSSEKSRVFIKYILSNINRHFASSELDYENISIEHIMPQKPSSDWGLSRSDIKEYVDVLGNLTLIDRSYNSEAGNKSIKDKAKIFAKSQIKITKEIADLLSENGYKWTKNEIESRLKGLTDVAYNEVWAF